MPKCKHCGKDMSPGPCPDKLPGCIAIHWCCKKCGQPKQVTAKAMKREIKAVFKSFCKFYDAARDDYEIRISCLADFKFKVQFRWTGFNGVGATSNQEMVWAYIHDEAHQLKKRISVIQCLEMPVLEVEKKQEPNSHDA